MTFATQSTFTCSRSNKVIVSIKASGLSSFMTYGEEGRQPTAWYASRIDQRGVSRCNDRLSLSVSFFLNLKNSSSFFSVTIPCTVIKVTILMMLSTLTVVVARGEAVQNRGAGAAPFISLTFL